MLLEINSKTFVVINLYQNAGQKIAFALNCYHIYSHIKSSIEIRNWYKIYFQWQIHIKMFMQNSYSHYYIGNRRIWIFKNWCLADKIRACVKSKILSNAFFVKQIFNLNHHHIWINVFLSTTIYILNCLYVIIFI